MSRKPIESSRRRVTSYLAIVARRRPVDEVFFDDAQPAEVDAALDKALTKKREAQEVFGKTHGAVRIIAWRKPPSGHMFAIDLPVVGEGVGAAFN